MTAKRREARGGKRHRGPASTNWALGRRNAPFLVEKPERYRPEMLLLIDVGANWMVALEAVEPRLPADAVAERAAPKIGSGVRAAEALLERHSTWIVPPPMRMTSPTCSAASVTR
jgi:hypothetical protein